MKTKPNAESTKAEMKRAKKTRTTPRRTSAVGRAVISSLEEIRAWQRGAAGVTIVEMTDPIPPVRANATRR